MAFTHLHLHTEYSLLDGVCRFGQLFDAAKSLGQKSIAITDHGNMFGAIDFYKAAIKNGIKPIIGCEVYVAARSRLQKVHGLDTERYHLILLCKNNTGYENLIKMVSESWVNGFYVKPRIDRELLEKYHEGIIALSACLAGEIPQRLLQNDYESAKEAALWYNNIFGEGNYYLEIQNHGIKEQLEILPKIAKLSKDTGIPLVATNDVHYINRSDSKIQKVLICIQTNHTIDEDTGLEFGTDDFYLKSENEMRELFSEYPEAIDNTAKIAEICNVTFEFGKTKLPRFDVPDNKDHFEYFKEQCCNGLIKIFGENPDKIYTDRLDYEMSVINSMGYVDYFLIVADFIHYAKSKNIPVGPGRGSGAGSLAAYCMDITGIDPIKYNLLFERFLNPERVSMPDIDVDFCYVRREEVIEYVIQKYGKDHVAQIVTFGTMAARGAIRDVGRALGIPYNVVDSVSKQIPHEIGMTIEKALIKNQELKDLYDKDEKIRELINTAQSVEGMPRHTSTHAAGVVITDKPVDMYVPLARNDEAIVTQYTMTAIEELGLLKMDFLGLRTLTVIDDTVKAIKKKNQNFDIEAIPLDDALTYEMMSEGSTYGVFQCESAGLRSVLTRLKPESIEDIIAVISLYRPGPMDSIDKYIANRNNPLLVQYKTPKLKDILDVTYGCMVYQEQVMQIFRELAGYSLGRADIVRRAMSKKKHKVMEEEREIFINGLVGSDGKTSVDGCLRRGISKEIANSIFDDMSSFASYAFNKSHSAAYAVVAYRTAYLKCHYPAEFMASLITSVIDESSKVSLYIDDLARLNIKVIAPHVNSSELAFTSDGVSVRFGMLAIKNLGTSFINSIIKERETYGKFASLYNFCKRTHGKDFNKRAVEGLIKCGALDNLGMNRREMLTNLPDIIDGLDTQKRRNVDGQIGLFDIGNENFVSSEPSYKNCDEFPKLQLLSMEKEMTGMYLSGHPMAEYTELSEKLRSDNLAVIVDTELDSAGKYHDGSSINILGIITAVKKKTTKSDNTMAFLTFEDVHSAIEVIVFPKLLLNFSALLYVGNIIYLCGRLSLREDEEPKLILDSAFSAEDAKNKVSQSTKPGNDHAVQNSAVQKKMKKGLFIRFDSSDREKLKRTDNLISIFEGMLPVYYYFKDTKQYKQQKFLTMYNEPMIKELKKINGENNVIIQQ